MRRAMFDLASKVLLFSMLSLEVSYAQTSGEEEKYSISHAIEDLGGLAQARSRARTFLFSSGFASLPALEAAKASSDAEVVYTASRISQLLRDNRQLLALKMPARMEGTPESLYYELEALAERNLPRLVIEKEHALPARVETFGHSLWTHFNSYCEKLNLQLRVVRGEVCLVSMGHGDDARHQQRIAVGPLLFVLEQALAVEPLESGSPLDLDILVLVERRLVPQLQIEPLIVGQFDSIGSFGLGRSSKGPLYLRTREVSLYAHSEECFDFAYQARTAARTKADADRDLLNGVLVIQTNYKLRGYPRRPLVKLNAGWKRIAQLEIEELVIK
jgi:hypothetical protein